MVGCHEELLAVILSAVDSQTIHFSFATPNNSWRNNEMLHTCLSVTLNSNAKLATSTKNREANLSLLNGPNNSCLEWSP